jgi:hypothetical protein
MTNCDHKSIIDGSSAIVGNRCTLCGNVLIMGGPSHEKGTFTTETLQPFEPLCTCGGKEVGIHSAKCPVGVAIIAGRSQGSAESVGDSVKMSPGEVDKVFQASCPKCDGRIWIFAAISSGSKEINQDCRWCSNCGYVHWLRGPNESEVIPLPSPSSSFVKKDRVRALVFAMLASPHGNIQAWPNLPDVAKTIDDRLERIEAAGDSQSRRESPRGQK